LSDAPITRAQILKLYLPLAASWIFMAIEAPTCVRIISNLGQGTTKDVWTAAFNVLMAYSLFIESPVIDLLSTSTTLTKSKQSFATVSRFVWLMMGWCTVVHALAVTPGIYQAITANLNPAVAEALHLPLAVMIPWSACIGWRRYKQGILIRNGQTKVIGLGTFLRVATIFGVGFGLAAVAPISGIMICAIALLCSVFAESMFIHFAARKVIADLPESAPDETPLSLRSLSKFHFPLTVTTMVTLSTGLVVTEALKRVPDSVTAMAGWQVALTIVWLHRTIVFALPEVVITLYRGPQSEASLRKFTLGVGIGLSALMFLFAFTGIDRFIFGQLLGASPQTVETAHQAFLLQGFLPLISAVQSFARGVLTAKHQNVSRLYAVMLSLCVLVGILALGVSMGWPGVKVAAAAISLSLLVELMVLWRALVISSQPPKIANV
jgi:progressive ankylosis protein